MSITPLFPDFTGLILDGGRATRLSGVHKSFIEVNGRPIASRTTELFRRLFADVVASSNRPGAWLPLSVRCVADRVPGLGPLAGIAAGLEACSTPYAFVAGGDMPELSEDVVAFICRRAMETGRSSVPRIEGRAEPLHAAYAISDRTAALEALDRGVRKLTDFLDLVPVTWIEGHELGGVPGADRTFRNVNTPEDLGI
jgi:molybdopterin-guanine dinucleotide biosynthesis protein A